MKCEESFVKYIIISLLLALLPLILFLSLLQKINSSFETYENEMKKWHDNDPESYWVFMNEMHREQIL